MPSSTSNWNIPYALPTDQLCDGGNFIGDMAFQVENLLGVFNGYLDRILTPPYAAISTTTAQPLNVNIPGGSPPALIIDYDTVNADTGGYTNVISQPSIITIPAQLSGGDDFQNGGFYLVCQYMMAFSGTTPVNVTNAIIDSQWHSNNGTSPLANHVIYEDDISTPTGGTANGAIVIGPDDGTTQLYSELVSNISSSFPTTTLTEGCFFVIWMADQE